MSPVSWPSNVAYTVAASNRLASTWETHVPRGRSGTRDATLFHVPPSFRVTWRLPSSVPTHTTCGSLGDSLIV